MWSSLAVFATTYLTWQSFSLVEYCVHRILHDPVAQQVITKHKRHHISTIRDFFYNTSNSIYSFFQLCLCLGLVTGSAWAIPVYEGWSQKVFCMAFCYIFLYNLTHMMCHLKLFFNRTRIGLYHEYHHMFPFYNFGVSSLLWDYFFGSLHPAVRLTYPLLIFLPAPFNFCAVEVVTLKHFRRINRNFRN